MAALTLAALVGEGRLLRVVREHAEVSRGFRQGGQRVRKHAGFERLQTLHVGAIHVRAQPHARVRGVLRVVVPPLVLVSFERAEGPGRPLDLARLRHHEAVPLHVDVIGVARSARVLVNPRAAWVGIERLHLVCVVDIRRRRVATMADNATGRVTPTPTRSDDLLHHLAARLANRLDALVTRQAFRLRVRLVSRSTLGSGKTDKSRQGKPRGVEIRASHSTPSLDLCRVLFVMSRRLMGHVPRRRGHCVSGRATCASTRARGTLAGAHADPAQRRRTVPRTRRWVVCPMLVRCSSIGAAYPIRTAPVRKRPR